MLGIARRILIVVSLIAVPTGTAIATTVVAAVPAGSHSAAPSIYRSIAYDPRELQPIGLIAGTPLFFVVRQGFPARTMQEFLTQVR